MKFTYYTMMIITGLLLGLFLAACGGGEEPTPTPEPLSPTEELAPEPTAVPTEEPAPEPTEEPAPEPTEEPLPTADFVEFTDEAEGVTLSYPADWVYDDSFFLMFASNEDLLMETDDDSEGALAMVIAVDTADFADPDPMAAIHEIMTEFEIGDAESVRGGITAVTINDQQGAAAVVDSETDTGKPIVGYVVLLTNNGRAAIFMGMTPAETETEYLDTLKAMAETIVISEPTAVENQDPTDSDIAFDPGNSQGLLWYGETFNGIISNGEASIWNFIGSEGEILDVRVEPVGDTLDVIVDIFDETGTSILDFPVDDSFSTEEILGLEIPSNGIYYVVITSYDGSDGAYAVTMAEAGTLDDGSGTRSNLDIGDGVTGGEAIYGEIHEGSHNGEDAGLWTFTGRAGEFANITVSPQAEGFDVTLDVLDPAGDSMLDGVLDDSEELFFTAPADGNYFFRIAPYANTLGDYEVALVGSDRVIFELVAGDRVYGRFGKKSFDYFIGADAGDTYSFSVETEDEIDLVLSLEDLDENLLAGIDEGSSGENEQLNYTFEAEGLYLLRVTDFLETGSGPFILSID